MDSAANKKTDANLTSYERYVLHTWVHMSGSRGREYMFNALRTTDAEFTDAALRTAEDALIARGLLRTRNLRGECTGVTTAGNAVLSGVN